MLTTLIQPVISMGVRVLPSRGRVPPPISMMPMTIEKVDTIRRKAPPIAVTSAVAPITAMMESENTNPVAAMMTESTTVMTSDCLAIRSAPALSPAPMLRATSAWLPTDKPANATWSKYIELVAQADAGDGIGAELADEHQVDKTEHRLEEVLDQGRPRQAEHLAIQAGGLALGLPAAARWARATHCLIMALIVAGDSAFAVKFRRGGVAHSELNVRRIPLRHGTSAVERRDPSQVRLRMTIRPLSRTAPQSGGCKLKRAKHKRLDPSPCHSRNVKNSHHAARTLPNNRSAFPCRTSDLTSSDKSASSTIPNVCAGSKSVKSDPNSTRSGPSSVTAAATLSASAQDVHMSTYRFRDSRAESISRRLSPGIPPM